MLTNNIGCVEYTDGILSYIYKICITYTFKQFLDKNWMIFLTKGLQLKFNLQKYWKNMNNFEY
jgi:hypothetical protein